MARARGNIGGRVCVAVTELSAETLGIVIVGSGSGSTRSGGWTYGDEDLRLALNMMFFREKDGKLNIYHVRVTVN